MLYEKRVMVSSGKDENDNNESPKKHHKAERKRNNKRTKKYKRTDQIRLERYLEVPLSSRYEWNNPSSKR